MWSTVRNALCPNRRSFCTTIGPGFKEVQLLKDGSVDEFRKQAFGPAIPAIFPQGQFANMPALTKWFIPQESLNRTWILNQEYLQPFGEAVVPLELTRFSPDANDTFQRFDAPLSAFLSWEAMADINTGSVYLAQAPITNFPQQLRSDVPVPSIVSHAGTGDIYDTNLWIGRAPTHTPLHRDPNPNLFVQLAGRKVVKLFAPNVGLEIFARVNKTLGGHCSSVIRGEEMMVGEIKRALEEEVWESTGKVSGFEARLDRGDGLFIPKGWWHSIKGVGEGITGSVNWWFR
jgi:hypothetical protein